MTSECIAYLLKRDLLLIKLGCLCISNVNNWLEKAENKGCGILCYFIQKPWKCGKSTRWRKIMQCSSSSRLYLTNKHGYLGAGNMKRVYCSLTYATDIVNVHSTHFNSCFYDILEIQFINALFIFIFRLLILRLLQCIWVQTSLDCYMCSCPSASYVYTRTHTHLK